MAESLEGKVAIVTGGSRGIGRAIAAALLQKGVHVAINGINKERLEKAEAELIRVAAGGARVLIFAADVRDHLAVQSLVDETARRQGGIDILVNNAGVGWFGNVESQGHDDWRRVVLRVESSGRCVQRSTHAGSAARWHPRKLHKAWIGQHRLHGSGRSRK